MPEMSTIRATDSAVTMAEFSMKVPSPTFQARPKLSKLSVSGRPSGSVKISRRVLNAANSIQVTGISTKMLQSETTP